MQAGTPDSAADRAEELLRIVVRLAGELHPSREGIASGDIDSRLDRDFGFDSLSRVELFSRIEQAFAVRLAEQVFATAETPRQILEALRAAVPELPRAGIAVERESTPQSVQDLPVGATTLVELLDWHADRHPERRHITLLEDGNDMVGITYGELRQRAGHIAAGLMDRGFRPGETAAIMLPTGRDYFPVFFGILLAGGIPVPIYPPARLSQIEDHLTRHAGILDNAGTTLLVTIDQAIPLARLLRVRLARLKAVATPEELEAKGERPAIPITSPLDLAFLQYTSGSTGNPKGVMLSHANLLANIRAMGEAARVSSADTFVSWLPLYHDMGLIGAWLGSLYFAAPLVIMSPLAFLSRPERWLWAIHRFRASLSAAPNFAYELCLRKIDDQSIRGLDLSSWRMALNGAEPVSPATMESFSSRFAPFGFRPGAVAPVYGLAECTVGLTFPPPGRGLLLDRIDRDLFAATGEARPIGGAGPEALTVVACGRPLSGHRLRVVDKNGNRLPERREGRLQFRGPSATSGYFRNRAETEKLFDVAWLESGDLAYLADGDVYLTGRSKDMIIKAGRNLYPYELEEAVAGIDGIRKGCVAVFGSPGPLAGGERLVVLAETRRKGEQELAALRESITRVALELLEMAPDDIVLAPPGTVLKTSSGKIRRRACRDWYERGGHPTGPKPVWLQFASLIVYGAAAGCSGLARTSGRIILGCWAWLLFAAMVPAIWPVVALSGSTERCWSICRRTARLFLRLAGIRLHIDGIERLPSTPFLVVANHASYLDGIILAALLPGQYSFVAKRELSASFITRIPLTRLGAAFVERFDLRQGIEDARRILEATLAGRSPIFFPEGTFRLRPGLLPFRMGAFMVAVDAATPVVPVAMSGARDCLPEGSWLLRPGIVSVIISAPITPQGSGWEEAIRLRDKARRAILAHCGEPDLEEL